jgi:polysaccharide pyruvyl transferase CsaB
MADDNLKMYNDALRDCRTEATILGYYGYGNSGDDALLSAIISDMKKIMPTFTPVVLSNDAEKTKNAYGVDSVYRFSAPKVIKALKKSKLLIVGGGSLIQDITSTKSLIYYLWCIKQAKRLGLKVMLYANGIGPVTKKANIKKAGRILNLADIITLRDEESAITLKEMGVIHPEIFITADPAFSLEPCDANRIEKIKKELSIDKDYICVSVRNWSLGSEKTLSSFAKMTDYICKNYNLLPVFVPMQQSKDKNVSKKIMSLMNTKGICLENELPTKELLGLIGGAKAVVAVRLHMLIFGAISSVPSLGIEYDPKIKGFLNYVNQPYCITPDDLENETYQVIADKFMASLDSSRQGLKENLSKMKEKSFENALIASKLIEK